MAQPAGRYSLDEGHVSAADVDFADLGRRETLLDQDRPECIERGVNAGDLARSCISRVACPRPTFSLAPTRNNASAPERRGGK